MKILIAEDDNVSRRILETILSKWNYEVVSSCNGAEAWERLQEEGAPRLAILDWMMPEMSGVDVCRLLRSDSADHDSYVYVILLTAKSEKTDIVTGIEAGADDYILKPFDGEELRVRVRAGQRIVELHSELVAAKNALTVQALHDPLTGILNRRAIFNILDTELSRSKRSNKPLSVIMCDIDRFKTINDTYGHQAGDEVLCEIVRRIRSALREYDQVGRYGGEEFLIVTPGTCGTRQENLYERIRSIIVEQPIRFKENNVSVTASLGVASSLFHSGVDELIRAADAALYRAKNQGRNRVEYADDLELQILRSNKKNA